jgi:hypothetical protein
MENKFAVDVEGGLGARQGVASGRMNQLVRWEGGEENKEVLSSV